MGKPTALDGARRVLRDGYVVDVRKGACELLHVDTVMDSPAPLYPGRYVMLAVRDMELVLKRLAAVESAAHLRKAVKRTGIRTLKRR